MLHLPAGKPGRQLAGICRQAWSEAGRKLRPSIHEHSNPIPSAAGHQVSDRALKPRNFHRICVGVLTFKRPDLLSSLLDGLAKISLPADIAVSLIIIDNDFTASAKTLVQQKTEQLTAYDGVNYIIGENPGVACARNRVLEEALRLTSDLICFIDDDEVPTNTWLENLVACAENSGAQLIGGPVRLTRPRHKMTPWQWFVFWGASMLVRKKKISSNASAAKGRLVTIVTNNWCIRADYLRSSGLRFDERFNKSGGEDTDFFHRAVAAGCKTHWCPDAIVMETPTLNRLSLKYHFGRARHQSIVHYHQKADRGKSSHVAGTVVTAALRIAIGALIAVVLFPIPAAVVSGARSIGWGVGRINALNGKARNFFALAR